MGDRLDLEIGLMTGKLAQVKCLEQIVRSQIAPGHFANRRTGTPPKYPAVQSRPPDSG
jgi:hypothetical protein